MKCLLWSTYLCSVIYKCYLMKMILQHLGCICIFNCHMNICLWAQPHAAMLHICDGVFQNSCDAGKLPAMVCDAFSNMLVILLPILEYLSYFLSDFQTVFSKMMGICDTIM